METKFLKPAKTGSKDAHGNDRTFLVRLENATRHLLAEGEDVVMSAY